MRQVSDIVISAGGGGDDGDKGRTWVFISSILSIYYPDIDVKKLDGIKAICLEHHPAICKMSGSEYAQRLEMIKAICTVPNMPGLWANYKTGNGAIRIACGDLNALVHDYHVVVPINYNTGELKRIAERDKIPTNPEIAKAGIQKLKEMFND